MNELNIDGSRVKTLQIILQLVKGYIWRSKFKIRLVRSVEKYKMNVKTKRFKSSLPTKMRGKCSRLWTFDVSIDSASMQNAKGIRLLFVSNEFCNKLSPSSKQKIKTLKKYYGNVNILKKPVEMSWVFHGWISRHRIYHVHARKGSLDNIVVVIIPEAID